MKQEQVNRVRSYATHFLVLLMLMDLVLTEPMVSMYRMWMLLPKCMAFGHLPLCLCHLYVLKRNRFKSKNRKKMRLKLKRNT